VNIMIDTYGKITTSLFQRKPTDSITKISFTNLKYI